MTEEIEDSIKKLVAQNKLSEAITLAEGQIIQNPIADFAGAVGRSLLHLTDDLVEYLNQFYAAAGQEIQVQSLYAAMNGFTINCDLWYVDLFAFDRDEGLNDTDWLADDSYAAAAPLPITGLEDIQAIYENYAEKWEAAAGDEAAHDCAALIILRVQELFNAAKAVAAAQQLKWATLPIYVTSHDAYIELLYRA